MARWEKIEKIPDVKVVESSNRVTLEWKEISVITPIFGGGVRSENFEHDDITPIRVSEIKGQLRFWWRASSGFAYGNKMYQKESEIWGSTSQRACATVSICPSEKNHPCKLGDKKKLEFRQTDWFGYVAFPIVEDKVKEPQNTRPSDINNSFNITILCQNLSNEQVDEIKLAVECFLSFGGIGGRTRRGFGAIHASDKEYDINQILEKIKNKEAPDGINFPNLYGSSIKISSKEFSTAEEAMEFGINKLRSFRGTKVNNNKFGKSTWPEAGNIRARRFTESAFPRGQFGMPIHFKEKPNSVDIWELIPKDGDDKNAHMASPIILRPYKNKNGKYIELAIRLNGNIMRDACLINKSKKKKICTENVSLKIRTEDQANFNPLFGNTDPLKAFLDYFAK